MVSEMNGLMGNSRIHFTRLMSIANYHSKYFKTSMHNVFFSPLEHSADLIFQSCTCMMLLIGPVVSKITLTV